MLFNSYVFIIFFVFVYFFYWFVTYKNLKLQNLLLLLSSYVFYGWWDYRFLILIFLSTIVDYYVGLNLEKRNNRKLFLYFSIFFNIGLLGIFKYFNFFVESFQLMLSSIGYQSADLWTLKIILPVGISFYTFQTLSYTIDIYNNKLKPTKSFLSFGTFVAFFPQLVAGPIEKAKNLLPQIEISRKFNYKQQVDGLKLILWGMFKKVVIADTLAGSVDTIFYDPNNFNGGVLILGAIYFSIQIYCDFSGYSDIAIGLAKNLGIELKSNFNFPYFSKNIREFWQKWHISLTSWFREYLYFPLGGSKFNLIISIRNLLIIFLVSGLWHGANWTFVFWGLWHCVFYIPFFVLRKYNISLNFKISIFNKFFNFLSINLTFLLITISWIFFRSETISKSFEYLTIMIYEFDIPNLHRAGLRYVFLFFIFEWLFRNNNRELFKFKSHILRWITFCILCVFIIAHFHSNSSNFIYFQF